MDHTTWPPDDRQQLRSMLAHFLELLSAIRPLSSDVGDAYVRGEDIPGADVGHLHGVVALRDDLVGLQHYLRVCGIDMRVPGLLVTRGDWAELELADRTYARIDRAPTRSPKARTVQPAGVRRGGPVIEAGPETGP